jgi:hypothetical protein
MADENEQNDNVTLRDLMNEIRQQRIEVQNLREEVQGNSESVSCEVKKLKKAKDIVWKYNGNKVQIEFNEDLEDTVVVVVAVVFLGGIQQLQAPISDLRQGGILFVASEAVHVFSTALPVDSSEQSVTVSHKPAERDQSQVHALPAARSVISEDTVHECRSQQEQPVFNLEENPSESVGSFLKDEYLFDYDRFTHNYCEYEQGQNILLLEAG